MNTRTKGLPLHGLVAALALALLVVVPGRAQEPEGGPGWTGWLGCWEAVEDGADPASLCVVPAGAGPEVELLTVEDGEVVDTRTVRADGERRDAAREGCTGWERAVFSRDGQRVHLRSQLECEGGVVRESSGMFAFVSSGEWIDVRAVGVDGRRSAWVRRYRPAEAPAGVELELDDRRLSIETARMAAGSPPDLEAVLEASERVHPEAVTAWIVELGRRFRLDGERLLRLAEAGVPDEVIDVLVAVSHPERFSVGGEGDVSERAPAGRSARDARHRYRSGTRYGNPFLDRPYRFRDPYRFGWRYGWGYGFTPWSYGRFGWRYGGVGYRPVVIRVEERVQQPEGRVVNGRGYTRTDRSEPSGSSASSSPTSGRTGTSGVRPSSRSSISTSGGYSSGSSSGSGRKAKPRGSGGSSGSGESGGSGGR